MFTKLKSILISIFVVVGLIAAAFLRGRSSGKEEVQKEVEAEKAKEIREVANERVETITKVKDIQKEVIKSLDKSVSDELKSDWTRD